MSVSAPLLLAALLFLASPSSAQPALAVSGVTLSEGFGLRETARLTFDRKKASSGGFIYAVPRASAADERAVRLSAAVLTAEGRALGVAAVLARRHNVAALALPGARWQAGALVVERPVFGPTVFRRGLALRPLEGFQERSLREGEVVTVDPARGLLLAYDPSSQAFELELAQALRAFDGLKDMQ
ncbi:MAG: hypothetical protein KGK30_09810, partial [Elusimicrobia bacterium]|nr:hypothetical protein [Elusimicrobiota bacterium]